MLSLVYKLLSGTRSTEGAKVPYTKPRKRCPHGWYVDATTIASSALFNTSTECPRCRKEASEAAKSRRAALLGSMTPEERQKLREKEKAQAMIYLVVVGATVGILLLIVHAVLAAAPPTP
jgi:hypothetical protein